MLFKIIIIIQVLSALVIVGLVLMQHGKGADMGAAFGAGASGSLFGATGSSNFLSRSTAIAAVIFFISTLFLAYVGTKPLARESKVMEQLETMTAPVTPAKTEETKKKEEAATGTAAVPGVSRDDSSEEK